MRRAQAEADQLRADDHQQRAADQRVDEQPAAGDGHVGEHEQHQDAPSAEQDEPGNEEQEGRAVDEHQPQVPPAVAERRELRLAAARVERDRQLADRRGARWPRGSPSRRRTPSRSLCRSSPARTSRRTARMPQCASLTGVRKSRLRKPDRSGLPIRLSQCIAPGSMPCHPVAHRRARRRRRARGRSAGSPRSRR